MPEYWSHDFHIHSNASACAKAEMTVENIIATAVRKRLRVVGVSDHLPPSKDDAMRMIDRTRAAISGLSRPLTVFVGGEAQMNTPHVASIDKEVAESIDYVLIAANHYHLADVENPFQRTPEAFAAHHLAMLEGAVDTGFCDVIAHPFLLPLPQDFDQESFLGAFDRREVERILKKAVRAGVALEVNPRKYVPRAPWFFSELLVLAHRIGLHFAMGSDSHAIENIGDKGSKTMLKQLGFRDTDFIIPGRAWA